MAKITIIFGPITETATVDDAKAQAVFELVARGEGEPDEATNRQKVRAVLRVIRQSLVAKARLQRQVEITETNAADIEAIGLD